MDRQKIMNTKRLPCMHLPVPVLPQKVFSTNSLTLNKNIHLAAVFFLANVFSHYVIFLN